MCQKKKGNSTLKSMTIPISILDFTLINSECDTKLDYRRRRRDHRHGKNKKGYGWVKDLSFRVLTTEMVNPPNRMSLVIQ